MKPPPLLLGATLLFWGWQSELFLPGALLAVLLESARIFTVRWDFSDEDFGRVWTFCCLLLLGATLYAFTANDGPAAVGYLFGQEIPGNPQAATTASARTAATVLRWLPMIFFPFLLAQAYSTRETIPLLTISLIMQRRWKKAKLLGQTPLAGRGFNIGYPYFCATLLAASFHSSDDNSYFWGFCALVGWVLWLNRSRRFGLAVWAGIFIAVAIGGYFGQHGIGQLQQYLTNLNPQWFSRFMRRQDNALMSRTALGSLGNIKNSGQIVVRLQPENPRLVPAYLREASFRIFYRQNWLAGSSREDFQPVTEDSPMLIPGRWTMIPDKQTNTSVQIACYLEGFDNNSPAGLLPLPSGTTRLEKLFAYQIDKNSAGAVMAHGPGLVIFDARYGPGETIDMPPGFGTSSNQGTQRLLAEAAGLVQERPGRRGGGGRFGPSRWGRRTDTNALPPITPAPTPADETSTGASETSFGPMPFLLVSTNEDLAVPRAEQSALNAVIAELNLTNHSGSEVLRIVENFFSEKFTYRTWQTARAPTSTNQTPLGRFLLETRAGHCEYFATATVLLLRQLGIPARYATGYAVHEKSGDGYVVRLSDAHAWTLVWDDARKVWHDFETTPASWVEAERQKLSALLWLSDAWSRIVFEFSKFRNGQSKLQQYLVWVVAPGLVLLLYQIIFRRGRKRRHTRTADESFFASWPGLDSDFYRLEKRLADRGVPRGRAEPLQDWLRRVLTLPGLAALREPLEAVLRLHYRHRFDPLGLGRADREALQRETARCLEALAQIPEAAPAGK
jgi:hypothetical protein